MSFNSTQPFSFYNVGLVDLTAEDFSGSGIEYTGLPLWDTPLCNILPYLGAAADTINTVVTSGGRIMVNCQMGVSRLELMSCIYMTIQIDVCSVSRSAACVMSYLMIHQNLTAPAALTLMRRRRDVRPNDGFLTLLICLDTDLRMEREMEAERLITLSTKEDLPSLPKPWNFEFFTKDVTEEEVGSPLVSVGQPCPLRLSGFSSLNDTPSCSNSLSRRSSRSCRQKSSFRSRPSGFHQDSRSRSCDILEETDDDLETDNDVLASCDELEKDGDDIPILEKVKEIITEPEDTWRYPYKEDIEEINDCISSSGSNCNFSTTTKPDLIQPKSDKNILSMFKVSSAAQWRSISTKINIDLTPEDEAEGEEGCVKDSGNVNTDDTSAFEKITKQQLLAVCWTVKPWECPKVCKLTSLF